MAVEIDEARLVVSPTGVGVSLYGARVETREDIREWRGPIPAALWTLEWILASATSEEDREQMIDQSMFE